MDVEPTLTQPAGHRRGNRGVVRLSPGTRAARAPLAGHAAAGARERLTWRRLTGTVHVGNLLDRRYASFGIRGENALAPDGSPLADGEREARFLAPGMPRTVTLTLSIGR